MDNKCKKSKQLFDKQVFWKTANIGILSFLDLTYLLPLSMHGRPADWTPDLVCN